MSRGPGVSARSGEQSVRIRCEVADRAAVADRDLDDAGLHRVADAGHRVGQLRRDRDAVEIHPAAHADVGRAPERDRALGASSERFASAQRMNPPRHGAVSNGGSGSTMPVPRERPRRGAGAPSTHSRTRGRAGRRIAASAPRCRRRARRDPRGVRDRVTRGVELVRAVLLRVGPLTGGGEASRRAACPRAARSGSAASGHVDHGHRRDSAVDRHAPACRRGGA